jgi:hypothetical protein
MWTAFWTAQLPKSNMRLVFFIISFADLQGQNVAIVDYTGANVAVDLLPVPSNSSLKSAVFEATIPAMGYSTYFLQYLNSSSAQTTEATQPETVCCPRMRGDKNTL